MQHTHRSNWLQWNWVATVQHTHRSNWLQWNRVATVQHTHTHTEATDYSENEQESWQQDWVNVYSGDFTICLRLWMGSFNPQDRLGREAEVNRWSEDADGGSGRMGAGRGGGVELQEAHTHTHWHAHKHSFIVWDPLPHPTTTTTTTFSGNWDRWKHPGYVTYGPG